MPIGMESYNNNKYVKNNNNSNGNYKDNNFEELNIQKIKNCKTDYKKQKKEDLIDEINIIKLKNEKNKSENNGINNINKTNIDINNNNEIININKKKNNKNSSIDDSNNDNNSNTNDNTSNKSEIISKDGTNNNKIEIISKDETNNNRIEIISKDETSNNKIEIISKDETNKKDDDLNLIDDSKSVDDAISKKNLNLNNQNNNEDNNDDISFVELTYLEKEKEENVSLGINIGAFKTVYSIFRKENQNYISNVLLMNDSSRIIPSIICYSNTHRLFGENSISSLKRNLNSSYNNLSRLICYEDKNVLNSNEYKYNFKMNDKLSFKSYEDENLIDINSDKVISDYLSLINFYYFKKNNINYNYTSLSVPDFFNYNQRQKLKLICESIDLKDVKIYNESSTITMYYGYTKYKDLFVIESNKLCKNIFKYILFIDSGHSKTNFILSKYSYNKFSVLYVEYISELGGRNFDELLVKYCFEEFKKQNDLNIEMTEIIKYKLNDEIQKSRVKLSVNSEISLTIDALYDDYDLIIELKKDKFEELIKDYLIEFSNTLQNVIKFSKDNNFIIDYVEIAGELMRTPIIQNILTDNKLIISKTILIDEINSVGAAILRNYEMNNFPLKEIKTFEFYNYNEICYEIDYFHDILFPKGKIIDRIKRIDLSNFISNYKQTINIKIYFSDNNDFDANLIGEYLVEYEIDLLYEYGNNPIFEIEIDEELNLINGKIIYEKNQIMINDKNIKSGLVYDNINEKNNFISTNKTYINNQKKRDENYELFVEEKSKISKFLYNVRAIIDKKNLYNEKIIVQDLDRQLRNLLNNKNGELENIKNQLNEIYNKYAD